MIDAVSVSAESQARTWLAQLDAHQEADAAAATLNRVLLAHRLATADPHVREVTPGHALIVRAGWGEGEQVAYGRWLHARELRLDERRTRRSAALHSHERFAALLGARERRCSAKSLRCAPAWTSTRAASPTPRWSSSMPTPPRCPSSPRRSAPTSPQRLTELAGLHAGVLEAARAALAGGDSLSSEGSDTAAGPDEEVIRHALGRLEAALRARAAAGLGAS